MKGLSSITGPISLQMGNILRIDRKVPRHRRHSCVQAVPWVLSPVPSEICTGRRTFKFGAFHASPHGTSPRGVWDEKLPCSNNIGWVRAARGTGCYSTEPKQIGDGTGDSAGPVGAHPRKGANSHIAGDFVARRVQVRKDWSKLRASVPRARRSVSGPGTGRCRSCRRRSDGSTGRHVPRARTGPGSRDSPPRRVVRRCRGSRGILQRQAASLRFGDGS